MSSEGFSIKLLVWAYICRFAVWLAAVVYLVTVILLFHYMLKYYYHRCILQTELHPLRIFPVRCKRFRRIRRFLWFFIIVPFVYKRAIRTLKFYFKYHKYSWPNRAAYRSYFYFLIGFVYWYMRIEFDKYWDPEWREIKFFYYLYLCDVYYAHLDTPGTYCLAID